MVKRNINSFMLALCMLIHLGTSTAQQLPLSTRKAEIVDAGGMPIRLKGVNWWGANGSLIPYSKKQEHSKATDTHSMPFGLHVQHLDTIVAAIRKAGFNALRLPFSNEMLHDQLPTEADWVGPNTHLIGLTPLQVMDEVVKALTNAGIMVLLNNHSTTAHWCCNYDFNGLWYGKNDFYSQTTEDWIRDWVFLAERYRGNPKVIGADLRNEVRPTRRNGLPLPKNPTWGGGSKRDWHKAATQAGNAIHERHPEWLIVVEGINAQARWLTSLRFPHLKPVSKKPILLTIPNKLIYEVHNYSFSWIKANLLFPKRQRKYANVDSGTRMSAYEKNWGFMTDSSFQYTAPVILGEFGCSSQSLDVEPWLQDLTNYINQKNISFFWWTLEEELASEASYGILNSTLDSVNIWSDFRGKYLAPMLRTP
jgi:aryl-phospho-beta-D-glucosidase BglC (GH1 family)